MKYLWRIVNTGLIVAGLWNGYETMASETLRRANPDPIPCGILLVIMPLFALGTVYYSKYRWDQENKILARPFKLRKPSWNRNPINWWVIPCNRCSFQCATWVRWPSGPPCGTPGLVLRASGHSASIVASQSDCWVDSC
ncbi:MAG: hypothetical protein WAU89_09405 [Candidatus Acidiferrales bacterium]